MDKDVAGPAEGTAAAAGTGSVAADEVVRLAARAFERDRYLAALLSPRDVRPALIAIAAFAGEIARIPATVSEPMIGAIRLQWWRDAVAGMASGTAATGHPIADALASAVRRHDLPVGLLTGFIDAHEIGLDSHAPANDEALTAYIMATEGALVELALHVLGGPAAVERARPLAAPAQALGLTRLLIEFPAVTAQHRTLVPAPLLAEAGVSLDDLYARSESAAARIAPLLVRLADEAARHLALSRRQLRHNLTRRDALALAPLATIAPTLAAWRRSPDPVLERQIDILPLVRVTRLAWTALVLRI